MLFFKRYGIILCALILLLTAVMPFGSALADTLIPSVTINLDAIEAGDSVTTFRSSVSTSTPTVDKTSLAVTVTPADKTFAEGKTYTVNISGSASSGFAFPTNNNLKFSVYFNETVRVSSSNNAAASSTSFIYVFQYTVPQTAVTPKPEQAKPTVSKSPSDETVEAGGSCSFIARADVETHIDWYFNDTADKEYDCADAKKALPELRLKGEKDEKIILSKIPIEMDGWKIFCVFVNDKGESTETKKATIHVSKGKPVVTKSPTGETVEEGGKCAFVARADNADTVTWYLTDGSTNVTAKSAPKKFEGLSVSGYDAEKLVLSNIPSSLSGWKAYAEFENETGKSQSNQATITVNAAAIPSTPTPAASVTPAITDTPALTPEPAAETPAPEENPAAHDHVFANSWAFDEQQHYHICACGEKADAGQHQMISRVTKEATKKENGTLVSLCTVCGYSVSTVIPATGGGNTKTTLIVLLIVCAVLLVGCVVFLAVYLYKEASRNKRAERRHRLRKEPEDALNEIADGDNEEEDSVHLFD